MTRQEWEKAFRKARRELGLPRFERECRLVPFASCRMVKAYKVPGTQEHGTYCMLTAQARRLAEAETGLRWPFFEENMTKGGKENSVVINRREGEKR